MDVDLEVDPDLVSLNNIIIIIMRQHFVFIQVVFMKFQNELR